MGPGGFFPTSPDLADILGDTDFNFEDFDFLFFGITQFADFQVPDFPNSRFPGSQISKFLDFQISRRRQRWRRTNSEIPT